MTPDGLPTTRTAPRTAAGAAPGIAPRATTRAPVLARSRGELARGLATLRRRRSTRVATVMTMGALHEGHAALIRDAHRYADAVVVTIFVNPLQFGPAEDLDRYPRTLEADLALCAREGTDLVFAPTPDVVYPEQPRVTVAAGELGAVLEGASRPGHFDGVLTVVAKLLNLLRPDVALFGEKDAQQLVLIRRMVRDLDVPVHVVGVPTVREPDGLALSSRNRYLDPGQRQTAGALSRALAAGAAAVGGGPTAVLTAARAELDAVLDLRMDYLALVDPATLEPVAQDAGDAVLAAAAYVGPTRLIDNVSLTFTSTLES
ncbi:MAG: pantoate--beta-alanine ligase [Actinomycetota bacterium]|nr:pantoate--beta-alanine ligase [Actinomycetota bacterium]